MKALTVLFVLAVSAFAQQVVPITSEPHHHAALSNEYVRAYKVEVAPHDETLYHQHDYDYIYVTIGDSDVSSVKLNEQPVHLTLKDGETRFTKGGFAHKAVNHAGTPFRNVTVELLKGAGRPLCEQIGGKCGGDDWRSGPKPLITKESHSWLVVESTTFEVVDLQLESLGIDLASLPKGHHPLRPVVFGDPLLVVAVTPAKLRIEQQLKTSSASSAGPWQEESLSPGDFVWVPRAESRKIRNLTKNTVRLVILDFAK